MYYNTVTIYLIHLGPDELLAVVVWRHELVHDVDEAPEGVLLVHEEQGNGRDPVEALAVLDLGVVQAVRQQYSPQLRNT